MSFSFGTPKTDANPTGGFSFGGNSGAGDAKTNPAKPFGFSTPQSSTTSFNLGGFGTGTPSTTAQSTGFPLGGTPGSLNLTTTANVTPSFNLGATPASTTSLTSSTPAAVPAFGAATSAAAPAFKLSGTPAVPAFKIGGTPAASAMTTAGPTSTTGFGLLGAPQTTIPGATTAASVTPTAGGFTLGGTPAASTTSLSATATTTASFGFGLGATAAATKTNTTAVVTPSFSLGGAAKTTATTGFSLSTPVTSIVSTTTSAIPATGNLNFGQLVDAINKWTIDLDEQGKLFSNQAKQLNAWDRLLVSNGEKVLSLNSGIERVKQQQQQLDQELDFVLAQQKELEDLITPLEKELSDIPLTDVDRLHTYQLAENMDTQLKQMSEDLKEIIEQLNESNKTHENSNPITQIRKILNAHMDSLQWIDRHTSKITGHLDQISKMHDLHRKSHEHSLKKTYD